MSPELKAIILDPKRTYNPRAVDWRVGPLAKVFVANSDNGFSAKDISKYKKVLAENNHKVLFTQVKR